MRRLVNRHPERALSDFFLMGGYAAYVWPAYGVAALVLIVLLVQSWRSVRRRDAELEQMRRVARPVRASRPKLQPGEAADRPSGAELAPPATE
jgi:heme exporter protein D